MTEYLRALWVWSPQHLSNLEEKKKLFEFCKQEKITHLYYQVIFNEKSFPHLTASVEGYEHYRDFIREAHSLKIKVYALNSRPHGVLRKGHAKIMAEIKALTEFNNKSRPEEQFDGAHYAFDIYMLDGFSGKSIRTFLVQLLQICKRARNFLFMRRPHLNFSVDMPFWFLTHQKGPLPRLVFDLRWKEAGEHLLDQVDEVIVFPYRNTFEGEDGIETLVNPTIEYANRTRKKVLVGLETMDLSARRASFAQKGKKELKAVEKKLHRAFKGKEGFKGIAIHDYTNYSKMT